MPEQSSEKLSLSAVEKPFVHDNDINETAELVIGRSRDNSRILREKAALEKTYSKYFFRIEETRDGKFRVILPGLVDTKTGNYVGVLYKEFTSWDEAKNHFLQSRENEEQLTRQALLEVQTGVNERISFSELDAFNPRVAPAENPCEISPSINEYLMSSGRLDGSSPSAATYQETIKEKDWEQELFSFVSSYLETEGAELVKEFKIEHLDALTPKQAAELAMRIVIDLTKYKWSDTKEQSSDGAKLEKTSADQATVLQLLKEGQAKRHDASWEGNGICRNFASAVKAVFEALKAKQIQYSQLRNTYCLYESGMDGFSSERAKQNVTEMNRSGHAWNTFVTVTREGAANATITDVTWAKRNLETKQIDGLDHTLTRMEPVVYAVGRNFTETTPNRAAQLEHLLSYYALKIEGSNQTRSSIVPIDRLNEEQRAYYKKVAEDNFGKEYDLASLDENQLIEIGQDFVETVKQGQEREKKKQFFVTRAVELMVKQGVPANLPDTLVAAIGQEYQKIADGADKTEIETLFQIFRNRSSEAFRSTLKKYLKDKALSDYHANSLIFTDDDLQRTLYEEIKTEQDFDKFIKSSAKFRVRMREVLPELFIDFSPATRSEDVLELKYLAGQAHLLSRFERMIDPRNPSEERTASFFEKVRQSLRELNPQKYAELVDPLDNYQVVKQYNQLVRAILDS